jgi:class 3 adenylate cyclase
MEIGTWLRSLDLERYEPAFRENEIDWEALPKLTAEDLKDLGVVLGGHRRRLLDAIAALDTAEAPPPATAASAAVGEAELRQLTVMFCDLVGSTPLSTRFDPEDLREIVGAYHRCVTDTVGRFGGFVAKYMGDGVLIYFGYPEAHEDDAERAARAGLAVIDAVGPLATQEPLNVRIGIATGLVIVGDLIGAGAAQERGVVGETPNLAARLQALARPGTLVVADGTRRQIGTLFEIEGLGPQPLAGFAVSQPAWRVVGESGVVSRFEALRSGTTPLVGRDEELDLLLRRWQQAKSGEGRVVLVSGEPGIGKSRLTAALSQRIESGPHRRLRYFCSPHDQDSALYPLIGQLERAAGFTSRRHDRNKARQARGAARRRGGTGRPLVDRGDAVAFRRRALPAARPQPAAQEGADLGSTAAAAPGAGAAAAGIDDLRGFALDRSELARGARPHGREDHGAAGTAGRDLPPRVPTALGRRVAGDGDRAEPARPQ